MKKKDLVKRQKSFEERWDKNRTWKYQRTKAGSSWNRFMDDIRLGGSLFADVHATMGLEDRKKRLLDSSPTRIAT